MKGTRVLAAEEDLGRLSAITLFANRATFDHFTCEWSYHAICE
jgi:hypothetical protein